MKIVGISACPAGLAHTPMAAKALEKAGKALGYDVKMEQQGSMGQVNEITKEEAIDLMKKAAKATYGRKGDKIVQMNYDAIDAGAKQVVEIEVPESWKSCEDEGLFIVSSHMTIDPVYGYKNDTRKANIHSEHQVFVNTDGIHPNHAGYRQMGDALAGAVEAVRS